MNVIKESASTETIKVDKSEFDRMLIRAGEIGAQKMLEKIAVFHLTDAAKLLGVSYATLHKRIAAGKIKTVDGRITGAEITRYLNLE
ncbi:MAG: hypothetical protein ACTIKR_06500 [Advenella sp.]|uniref:hypothetical protein n=1 Tax=Advenella sp. TaxID=1872388 RepID=UPI003F95E6CB